MAQSRTVANALEAVEPGLEVELVPLRTSGDERGGVAPSPARLEAAGVPGDKSRFVTELEDALIAGEADLAVHSAKDVPGDLPAGLAIVGVPEREDARDSLCGRDGLDDLAHGARVGTGSLRRHAQLHAERPDLAIEELRGNVDTRLGRLAEGRHDAIVLAVAGLRRLGRDEGSPLPTDVMCPAAGQGCLALEARVDDERTAALAGALTHRPSLVRLTAERALVTALAATCSTPLGAHAELDDDGLTLSAFVGMPDGGHWIRDRLVGEPERAALLGAELAARLVAAGAGPLLAAAEAAPEAAGRRSPEP